MSALVVTALVLSLTALAQVPGLVNYQGILTDDQGIPIEGQHNLTFAIYAASAGGAALWSETHSSVPVDQGLFNVILGSISPIDGSLFQAEERWIGITVDSDPEISPRHRVTAVPWALKSAEAYSAATVPDHDHDTRYFQKDELQLPGTINTPGNPVDWSRLKSVPPGFADGVDDGGGAGDGHSLDASDGDPVDAVYVGPEGYVGVGTTAPDFCLDVRGTSPEDGSAVQLANSDASQFLRLFSGRLGDPNPFVWWKEGSPLRFSTDESGWSEKMRITSAGDVGIGTSFPEKRLHVSSPVSVAGMFSLENSNPGDNEASMAFKEGSDASFEEYWVAGVGPWGNVSDFVIGRDGSKLVIEPGGNVGIGTSTPQADLHVYEDGTGGTEATLRLGGQGQGYYELEVLDQTLTLRSDVFGDVLYSSGGGVTTAGNLTANGHATVWGEVAASGDVTTDGSIVAEGKLTVGASYPNSETQLHVRTPTDNFGVLVEAEGTLGSEIGLHTATSQYASLVKNGYYYGGSWYRFNPSSGAFLQEVIPSGEVRFKTAAAGANPISWETCMKLTTDGRLECPVITITGGSDIAEPFDVEGTDAVRPGMVVAIDPGSPGKLRLADTPYDRCVAGVVSGAGGVAPGVVMGQAGSLADGEHPVAMTGRVYCWADATSGPIQPGDLLTTSDTAGHAMKVGDYSRANGAVLGKAMTTLEDGRGLVLVLVALQ
jgi:hypothetical protein